MSNVLTVGKRLIPRSHIAFVEMYAPAANTRVQTNRDFLGRVVMLNRDNILIEEHPEAFAKTNGFRMIADDKVAVNPAVHFRVETFLPAEGFTPAKAYMTRLLWRDLDGNDQSKLLLTEPETVLQIAVTGETGNLVAASGRGRSAVGRRRQRQPVSQTLHP
jgi:hypothetical protein